MRGIHIFEVLYYLFTIISIDIPSCPGAVTRISRVWHYCEQRVSRCTSTSERAKFHSAENHARYAIPTENNAKTFEYFSEGGG